MGPGRGEGYQSREAPQITRKNGWVFLLSIAYFKLKAVVTLTGVLTKALSVSAFTAPLCGVCVPFSVPFLFFSIY